MATYVTQASFDDHQRFTEQRLDNHDDRLHEVETLGIQHSVRLSGTETQDRVLQLAMQGLSDKIDARYDALDRKIDAADRKADMIRDELRAEIDDERTEMRNGFAQVNEQLREIRYILGFMVEHLGVPMPPMPRDHM